MKTKTCEHCASPLIKFLCDDCDGRGGWWRMAVYFDARGDDYHWRECAHCDGSGKITACSNFHCCGKKRYAPSALDATSLKAAEGSGDE